MISDNIKQIYSQLPEGVSLVAVSKFHPAEAILEAYNAGQRKFGESRVQEFLSKSPELPSDIEWHFIGHLQTNKVKQLIGKVAMIESVDSEKLLELINKISKYKDVVTNVLLQVHVAQEETKFGFSPEELHTYLSSGKYKLLNNIKIRGIMGMASNTDDCARIRSDFGKIKVIFDDIKLNFPEISGDFNVVSMGMSGDWPIAVEEGSNLIRVGTSIFGKREY